MEDISGSAKDYFYTTQGYQKRLFRPPPDKSHITIVQNPIKKQKERQQKEKKDEAEREKKLTQLSIKMIEDKGGAEEALDFLNSTDSLRSRELLDYLIEIDMKKKYGLTIPLNTTDKYKLKGIISSIGQFISEEEEYVEGGHRKRRSKQRRSKKRVSKKRPSKRRTQKRRSKKRRSKKRSKRRNL